MKGKIAGLIAVLALSAMPLVAHAGSDCSPPGDASEVTIPLSTAPAPAPAQPDTYVDADGPGVYQETNGLPGLQTAAYTCDEVTTAADARLI